MKQRPILFSTAMVLALLAGNKTQTRRIIKPQPDTSDGRPLEIWYGWPGLARSGDLYHNITPPYGRPGDVLWVRETFLDAEDYACSDYDPNDPESEPRFSFKADCPADQQDVYTWKPSIHMPRIACRLFLEIKSIRVERLQDISESDAIAEGIVCQCPDSPTPKYTVGDWNGPPYFSNPTWAYRELWKKINGPNSWDANPWVWVVEFVKIDKP